MEFVQIIEYRTSKAAEYERWPTSGKRQPREGGGGQEGSLSGPGQPWALTPQSWFDSYEAAMENSALPETDSLSKKMMTFADGPPTFYNLDVVDDKQEPSVRWEAPRSNGGRLPLGESLDGVQLGKGLLGGC